MGSYGSHKIQQSEEEIVMLKGQVSILQQTVQEQRVEIDQLKEEMRQERYHNVIKNTLDKIYGVY